LQHFASRDAAFEAMEQHLVSEASARARLSGAQDIIVTTKQDLREAVVEGQPMFIEATLSATASGRPRIAHEAADENDTPALIAGIRYGAAARPAP
jgi:hypothetical protein